MFCQLENLKVKEIAKWFQRLTLKCLVALLRSGWLYHSYYIGFFFSHQVSLWVSRFVMSLWICMPTYRLSIYVEDSITIIG